MVIPPDKHNYSHNFDNATQMKNKKQLQFLAVISTVSILLLFRYGATQSGERASLEIDVLKKVASNSIIKALSETESLSDAAKRVGVEDVEFERLCLALNIDISDRVEDIAPEPVVIEPEIKSGHNPGSVVLGNHSRSPYALVVEKATHTLTVVKYENGTASIVTSFPCKTGKNHGDKRVSGDQKTPEGVYFLTQKLSRRKIENLVGKTNAYQYGDLAFTTNFPNYLDRLAGKNGSGIWLHGTDEPFNDSSLNDTRGCVVTTNETINALSKYITLYETPLVILNTVPDRDAGDISKHRGTAETIIENWRSSWEKKDIDSYMAHYSDTFRSNSMTKNQWRRDKHAKMKRNAKFNIDISNLTIIEHNNGLVARFKQDYRIQSFRSIGMKTLYLVRERDEWKIVAEDFQKM